MSTLADLALQALRSEAERLCDDAGDLAFINGHLNRLQAWLSEMERQHGERIEGVSCQS